METDDSSRRWEKASNAAASIVDHGIDRALRPYFVFYLPVVTLLLVGLGVLLSGILFRQAAEPWLLRFSFGFAVAAIGTLIFGFVYGHRRIKPKVVTARSTPLLWLEKSEQKELRQQILGKTSPIPARLKVARGVAVEMRYQLARQLVWLPGMVYVCLGQMLPGAPAPSGFRLYFWALLLLLFLWLVGYMWWQYRHIGAFLDETPPPEAAT